MSRKIMHAVCMRLALMGAAAMPLQAAAHDTEVPVQGAAIASSNDMTIMRDVETGKLRAPTTGERAIMAAANAAKARNFRVAPTPTLQRYHPNGARGARLTDDFMSTSIAVIKSDGSLEKQCFESHEAAIDAMTAASTTATIKLDTE